MKKALPFFISQAITLFGFLPVGMALFGPLADHVSLRLLMVVSSVILIALSLTLLQKVGSRRTDKSNGFGEDFEEIKF